MDDRRKMRASDRDRQEVVDRLRSAVEDGRLKMEEYLDRMGLAYQAVTYGDLAPLHADLPAAGSMAEQEAVPPAMAPSASVAWRGADAAGLAVDTAAEPGTGTGLGVLSMGERAESLGGSCQAGPGGLGWLVQATLPLDASRRREGAT